MFEVFNFCAGPAMLPKPVMARAQKEFINWSNTGSSVMELSHRSEIYMEMAAKAESDLRDLMKIPANYKVLFCHGGGRGQFSAVPLNLLPAGKSADYIVDGSWSKTAAEEAQNFGEIVGQSPAIANLVEQIELVALVLLILYLIAAGLDHLTPYRFKEAGCVLI